MNKNIIGILFAALALGGLIWMARPDAESAPSTGTGLAGTLVIVDEPRNYDFGSISMAAGKVTHEFKIKNASAEPVTVNKLYTSCMCTTATLENGGVKSGPFGMPGHAGTALINQTIGPNEEAAVEVVFDPAAHGPAGVGRIGRAVILENRTGQLLQLEFTANVTP